MNTHGRLVVSAWVFVMERVTEITLVYGAMKKFGPRIFPNRAEMAVGFTGTNFQAKLSILEPFRIRFDVFGPA